MIALCEACANNDWERMREIKAVYADCGFPPPKHVWCRATDRPEDVRWQRCEGFRRMEWSA